MTQTIPYKLDPEVSKHPRLQAARKICAHLQSAGWAAYWVGGAVRDLLLFPNATPNDIDVATDAPYSEICRIFPQTRAIGKAFGVGLVIESEFAFEVATFRKESDYIDRRHPSQVGPGTLQEDSERRDFTINALYFDPVANCVVDFHNGLHDLAQRTLRCVGDAMSRLHEDPLRILRLYRFAANYRFQIDPQTDQSAQALAAELKHVSRERVLLEVGKLKAASVEGFAKSIKTLQSSLIGEVALLKLDTDSSEQKWPAISSELINCPGLIFACICAYNEGFAARDWPQTFKNWPLSLEEKAQLEFFQRICVQGFCLPECSDEIAWQNFIRDFRWLQRQSRITAGSALWLIQFHAHGAKKPGRFLTLWANQISHLTSSQMIQSLAPINVCIESVIRKRAQPLRDFVNQNFTNIPSDGALGLARAFIDCSVLLSELNCVPKDAPQFLNHNSEKEIASLCETARQWFQQGPSIQKK